jgi:hypothetical protein
MVLIRDEMAKSAATLISEFGHDLTLLRLSSSSYNSATGVATHTPIPVNVRAVLVAYRKEDIDGDSVIAGDRKAYIQVDDANTPVPGDKLTGIDIDVSIVSVHKILKSNTDSIVCICQARS